MMTLVIVVVTVNSTAVTNNSAENNQVFNILTLKVTVSHMERRKVQPRIHMVQHSPSSLALAGATLVHRDCSKMGQGLAWLGNGHLAWLGKSCSVWPANGCLASLMFQTSLMLVVYAHFLVSVPMCCLGLLHGLVWLCSQTLPLEFDQTGGQLSAPTSAGCSTYPPANLSTSN